MREHAEGPKNNARLYFGELFGTVAFASDTSSNGEELHGDTSTQDRENCRIERTGGRRFYE